MAETNHTRDLFATLRDALRELELGVGKEQRKISVGRWSLLHPAPC
jgi:hypothetical protein